MLETCRRGWHPLSRPTTIWRTEGAFGMRHKRRASKCICCGHTVVKTGRPVRVVPEEDFLRGVR